MLPVVLYFEKSSNMIPQIWQKLFNMPKIFYTQPITKKYPFLFTDPPEVSSAKRAVYAGPGDRDVLTCIVKAEPRANVSLFDCRSRTNDIYQVRIYLFGKSNHSL